MYKLFTFFDTGGIPEEVLKMFMKVLPDDRRAKALRYRSYMDWCNCAVAYLMLKTALKMTFGISEFSICKGENNKPFLLEYPEIFFNISHCNNACAVAVSDTPIGVDIQEIKKVSWKVASEVCCEEEMQILENCECFSQSFIKMWTVKESFVKMTGEGILNGLKNVNSLKIREADTVFRSPYFISVCQGGRST